MGEISTDTAKPGETRRQLSENAQRSIDSMRLDSLQEEQPEGRASPPLPDRKDALALRGGTSLLRRAQDHRGDPSA
jgi:hypothetical protein